MKLINWKKAGAKLWTAGGLLGDLSIELETHASGPVYVLRIDKGSPALAACSHFVGKFPKLNDAKHRGGMLYAGWRRDAEHESACDTAAASRSED